MPDSKKASELMEETDPTNGPALAMGAGVIIAMLSFIGLVLGRRNSQHAISCIHHGLIDQSWVVVAGIYYVESYPSKIS